MNENDLPKGWRRVVFGEVALNSTVVSQDPEAEGFERYIIGKHIPADGDRVETWGQVGDSDFGPRIRTIFQPGDVICTTRGPNLKVARVDFRGLGAHTNFVLRTADPDVLIQPYLEAVVRSDGFQRHLATNFRGSVNLFVNWSDAAKYKFARPPLDEQQRVVEVLGSTSALSDSIVVLSETGARMLACAAAREFDELRSGSVPMVPLASLCSQKPQSGIYKSEEFRGRGVRMVNMGELFGNDTIDDTVEMERIDVDEKELERYALTPNDLLFGRRSVVLEGAGRCVFVGQLREPVVFESSVLRATIDPEQADSRYVFEWLRSPYGHQQIRRIVTFTTVSGVAGSDVARLPVPVPTLEVQMDIADRLSSLRRQIGAPRERLAHCIRLSSVVTGTVMGSGE